MNGNVPADILVMRSCEPMPATEPRLLITNFCPTGFDQTACDSLAYFPGQKGRYIRKNEFWPGEMTRSSALCLHFAQFSGKHFPYFIKETFIIFIRLWFEIRRLCQLFQRCLFLGCQVLRSPYAHMNKLVALVV